MLKLINEQVYLPPKPVLVVTGSHLGSGTQHGSTIVDFELRFNLTSLLDLDLGNEARRSQEDREDSGGSSRSSGRSGRMRIKRYQPGSTGGSPKHLSREERNMNALELWAKKFCEDKAENRR